MDNSDEFAPDLEERDNQSPMKGSFPYPVFLTRF